MMMIPNMHQTYHSSHWKLLYSVAEVSAPLIFAIVLFFCTWSSVCFDSMRKKIMLTQNYNMGTDFIIIL